MVEVVEQFCVNPETTSDMTKQSKVCAFFKENKKEWDAEKINLHFSVEDAMAIVNTRVPQGCTKDRMAWVHSTQ